MTETHFICVSQHNVTHFVYDLISSDDDEKKNNTYGDCYFSNFSVAVNGDGGGGKGGKLPPEFSVISAESWRSIIVYSIIFIVASIGNIYVLISVLKRLQQRPSPLNKLLLHLTIADLMVVFIVIPVEIGWRLSKGWWAGDFMCKFVQYLRAFGLYLSSLVLICISLDRYYVVVYTLSAIDANKRVRMWIILSWITSALCSIPQVLVFREEVHPDFGTYRQCTSMWIEAWIDIVHTIFSLSVMYFLPLIVIIFTYSNIILTIQSQNTPPEGTESTSFLRRSSRCVIERARIRALKLTFVIVLVFLICWTPYVIVTLCDIMENEQAAEKPHVEVEVEAPAEKPTETRAVESKTGQKPAVDEPAYRPPTKKDFYVCLGLLLLLALISVIIMVAIYFAKKGDPDSFFYGAGSKSKDMMTATTMATHTTTMSNEGGGTPAPDPSGGSGTGTNP